MQPIKLPPPLKPGDLLQVIAPSGSLRELEAFQQGIDIWRNRGYNVRLGDNWDASYGYLAGNDQQRRQALAAAWQNPDCKGILCARGGYGSTRLLENWSWSDYTPKWLIGFSDVTALLWSLATVGIGGLHAPVLTTIAAEPNWSIERLFACVTGQTLPPLTGKPGGGGKATGRLLPANLTVATHILGTNCQPSLEGVILALEDVTEAPYRIDRLLTQWRMLEAFKGVKGIALGRFSRCHAPEGIPSWSVKEVLSDRLSDLDIPIVWDLPFGHDGVNAALPVGQMVELDSDQGIVKFLAINE